MDKGVAISIGIPVYNAEKYLAQAIRSVLNQSFRDFEIIITDDGSTDRSMEIARSFNDDRIIVTIDGQNKGISFRLNQQIEMARGRYFCRMDADDIALPERLEEQFQALEQNPGMDLVDSQAIIINEFNEIMGSRATGDSFSDIRHVFSSSRFIHPTVLFRKSFIREYLYRSDYDGAEDQDLWIRSFGELNAMRINKPLYFYREPDRLMVKTYLSRCKVLSRLYCSHRDKIRASSFINLILRLHMKRSVYWLAWFLKADSLLLQRRNLILSPADREYFQEKLQQAILNDQL